MTLKPLTLWLLLPLLPETGGTFLRARSHTQSQTKSAASAWAASLPKFDSKDHLGNSSKWASYLNKVYGFNLNDVTFPFDLKHLHFFYTDYLDEAGFDDFPRKGSEGVKELIVLGDDRDLHNLADIQEGDVYHGQLDGDPNYIMVYRPSDFDRRIKSDAKVEVFHGKCKDDRAEPFYWMYLTPGTGIFYDVGKTLKGPNNHEGGWPSENLAKKFDSVQYLNTLEEGIRKYEVVDLRSFAPLDTPSYVCPLAATAFFSRGQHCICNPTVKSQAINCGT